MASEPLTPEREQGIREHNADRDAKLRAVLLVAILLCATPAWGQTAAQTTSDIMEAVITTCMHQYPNDDCKQWKCMKPETISRWQQARRLPQYQHNQAFHDDLDALMYGQLAQIHYWTQGACQ